MNSSTQPDRSMTIVIIRKPWIEPWRVPRLKRASDIDPSQFDNGIDDEIFEKIIACIRIAVPYTGMIISTRESEAVRGRALSIGISQISGASRTSVGGYSEEERPHDTEQFDVSDQRSLDEVVKWLMDLGYLPSFCTACYREGRTGDRFMALCKSGQIQNCCYPNALMTLAICLPSVLPAIGREEPEIALWRCVNPDRFKTVVIPMRL